MPKISEGCPTRTEFRQMWKRAKTTQELVALMHMVPKIPQEGPRLSGGEISRPDDFQRIEHFTFLVGVFSKYYILWTKKRHKELECVWKTAFQIAVQYSNYGAVSPYCDDRGRPAMRNMLDALVKAHQLAAEGDTSWWYSFIQEPLCRELKKLVQQFAESHVGDLGKNLSISWFRLAIITKQYNLIIKYGLGNPKAGRCAREEMERILKYRYEQFFSGTLPNSTTIPQLIKEGEYPHVSGLVEIVLMDMACRGEVDFAPIALDDQPVLIPKTYVERLREKTYAHNHCPSCPSPHEVRLVGERTGKLDHVRGSATKDIVGYGQTFEEAAENAWHKRFGK